MAPTYRTFQFNVSFNLPVNNNETDQVLLSFRNLQGIKHSARNRHYFATLCGFLRFRVCSGNGKEFRRMLTFADTVPSTLRLEMGCINLTQLYLTAIYELKLSNVQANTKEAREIESNYSSLGQRSLQVSRGENQTLEGARETKRVKGAGRWLTIVIGFVITAQKSVFFLFELALPNRSFVITHPQSTIGQPGRGQQVALCTWVNPFTNN